MASLWIRSGLGWPERDFEVVIQTYQVGAHFKALDELVFMAPSEFFGIFFTSQTMPFEHCGVVSQGQMFRTFDIEADNGTKKVPFGT